MEGNFIVGPGPALYPADDDTRELLQKKKQGSFIRAKWAEMRNAKFFRKWWALAAFAYDLWSDHLPEMFYRGQRVQPEKERFRQDLTIMAGFYEPVFAADGTLRLKAKSLAWSNMDEAEFERLYSATISAVLDKIQAASHLTEDQLRKHVDTVVLGFG